MSESVLSRTPADSRTMQTYLLMPANMNGANTLFGGQLMSWIDSIAGIVAMRHCGGHVVTVAVDHLLFKKAAYVNDIVILQGAVTWVGSTSMEVRVDTWRETPSGQRELINTAFLVMVSVDENGEPCKAPALVPQTDAERAEMAAGAERSALRKRQRVSDQVTGQT